MSRIGRERFAALVFLVLCAAYGLLAFDIKAVPGTDDLPLNARSFPFGLSILGAAVALLLLVQPAHAGDGSDEGEAAPGRLHWGRAAWLVLLMLGFAVLIEPLGFVVDSALFLAGGFFLLGERRWPVLLAVSAGIALAFWLGFSLLDVHLPWGVFGRMW